MSYTVKQVFNKLVEKNIVGQNDFFSVFVNEEKIVFTCKRSTIQININK